MEIKLINQNTIFLKGKKESVLIDPDEKTAGLSKYQSRVIVLTARDDDSFGWQSDKVVIRGPGEYEIGGVEYTGLNGGGRDVVYLIRIDGVCVAIIGNLSETLSDKKVAKVENADVLLSSIKIKDDINAKNVLDWAKKWGVNYLVPMKYDDESLKKFLDAADEENLEAVEKLSVEKDNLPDGMEVVVLKEV